VWLSSTACRCIVEEEDVCATDVAAGTQMTLCLNEKFLRLFTGVLACHEGNRI
jgi:hypothetical protein